MIEKTCVPWTQVTTVSFVVAEIICVTLSGIFFPETPVQKTEPSIDPCESFPREGNTALPRFRRCLSSLIGCQSRSKAFLACAAIGTATALSRLCISRARRAYLSAALLWAGIISYIKGPMGTLFLASPNKAGSESLFVRRFWPRGLYRPAPRERRFQDKFAPSFPSFAPSPHSATRLPLTPLLVLLQKMFPTWIDIFFIDHPGSAFAAVHG